MTDDRLARVVGDAFAAVGSALRQTAAEISVEDIGSVVSVSQGVATVSGLAAVGAEELLQFPNNGMGFAFSLEPDWIGVVLLDDPGALGAGADVKRTRRIVDVPVGEALLGRVVDALGRPLDEGAPIETDDRWPIEREAPAILDRAAVSEPLQTGIKAIDALIPIGRGQRELILGDRQTGKTAIAVDTILSQRGRDVICVYCAIGQRGAGVAQVIADLRRYGAMEMSIVVVAAGEDPPGMQFIAPYAATTIAESFMERGRDVLIVYDDLTRHARAYRELSLLLRRPPGREAYPGDIFYVHARLLERATHLKAARGGGSLTALPIIETEAQNLSAYIPTNLISITDGQIYLTPTLFQKGHLPAIDIGRSVSRVGGKAQRPAYRAVAGELRLAHAQFEELEAFARFGTRLDAVTRRRLERGQRVREVMKQPQSQPIPVADQLAVLLAATRGLFDPVPLERIAEAEDIARTCMAAQPAGFVAAIEAVVEPAGTDVERFLADLGKALTERGLMPGGATADADA
jgi:F-type H+-transporting ATPase subunit alpha